MNDDDVCDPLTPSHLLAGRSLSAKPEVVSSVERNADHLTKRIQYLQTTMQSYWNHFRHVYLSRLREHHMYVSKRKTKTDNVLDVGDVVIIKEDNVVPRSSWKMGKVDSLVIGKDGYVRGANLSTTSKEGKRTKSSRPLQKLIPLEVVRETNPIVDTQVDVSPTVESGGVGDETIDMEPSRQRRACAIAGECVRRSTKQK